MTGRTLNRRAQRSPESNQFKEFSVGSWAALQVKIRGGNRIPETATALASGRADCRAFELLQLLELLELLSSQCS
jgi:hypothetical protein